MSMSAAGPSVHPPRSQRSLGIMAVSAATIAWGLVPLVLKEVRMPTLAFASWRLGFGAVVYGIALVATGRRLHWATIKRCAPGGLIFALDIGLSFSAFRLTSVANATIIGALAPVTIAIGASRWFGERLGRRDIGFMVASIAGVAMVAVGSTGSPTWSPLGDAFAAAGVISWTAYWLFSKRARLATPALEYMTTVMLVAFIAMTTVTALAGISLAPPQGQDWLWIFLVVLIPGAIGHLLVAWSHQHVEAWLGSVILQCQPLVASVAAWIVLGETLTPLTIVGGIVVLAATVAIVVAPALTPPIDDEPRAPDPVG